MKSKLEKLIEEYERAEFLKRNSGMTALKELYIGVDFKSLLSEDNIFIKLIKKIPDTAK